MTEYVLATNVCATLSADSPVIKAADVRAVTDAAALLHRAGATLAAAKQAAAEIEAAARASGLDAAAAAVEEQVAAQLRDFAGALASERAERRNAVAQLALGATKAILDTLPDSILIDTLVNHAIDQIDHEDIVEVTIGRGNDDAAHDQLLAHLAAQGLVARTDAALARGDCIVTTAHGRIIASIDAQIAGIARRWGLEPAGEA
ncbi:MAG: FliH/SctL family protein [Sphingomonas sp.]